MNRLNYQHLLYIWMTAREGTVARAAGRLCLVPSTLSSQIHDFEDAVGLKLFERRGRRLELTEAGRIACRYAEEIFSLGQEMQAALRGRHSEGSARLVVGVLDALSKPMVHRILDLVLMRSPGLRLTCREDGNLEDFLSALVTHEVDVVLSDAPARSGLPVRLFNHLLGESGTSFFASPVIARSLRPAFPGSLDGAAMLLPGRKSELHRSLGQWLETRGLRPRVIGEFDDTALLKLFGQMGRGIFAAPSVDEADITERYQVEVVGRADIRQNLYAITGARRIRHPAVIALTDCSREDIFGAKRPRRRKASAPARGVGLATPDSG